MSAADNLAARAARVREVQHTAAAPAPTPPPPAPMPRRQSVDMPGPTHRAFVHWRMEAALQLGRDGVTMDDAILGAVTAMIEDPHTSRWVRDWLARR